MFLNHPRGLAVLVALKVWELFSYQGMRAFLVLYLIATFALGDAEAAVLFGSYASLVLATAVFGGLIADRWLGAKEPMIVGACLIMAGHLGLALENFLGGRGSLQPDAIFDMFCGSLAFIAVGTGLLKPNVLNLIGGLYRRDDPRRDTGYYLYYIGVNIGSFSAPLVCGYLSSRYGWAYGFAAAALGMAAGLLVLILGRRHIVSAEQDASSTPRVITLRHRLGIYAGVAAAIALAAWLIQHGIVLAVLLAVTLMFGAVYLLTVARAHGNEATAAVWRFFAVMPVPALFVILFEQFSLSVNLFADRLVDRDFFGLTFAAPQLLSLNSICVLVVLPLLAMSWAALRERGVDPATTTKFAVGFGLMAIGFLVLTTGVVASAGRVDLKWVVAGYVLITVGELCIAPLTYAMVGKTLPKPLEGVGMGLLQLSFAIGNLCAGLFATLAAVPKGSSVVQIKEIYAEFFVMASLLGVGAAAFCLLIGRWFAARGSRAASLRLPA